MFTGIVSEVGRVTAVRRRGSLARLTVSAPKTTPSLKLGDSVAIAGVCQTVVELMKDGFTVETVPESLSRTTLGNFRRGHEVNLELPLSAGDPIGGHLVAGHVDGVGRVTGITRHSGGVELRLILPRGIEHLVVEKGSLAVDGVSLTVAARHGREATVALIPHTLEGTTLKSLRRGSMVNVEADLTARQLTGLVDRPPARERDGESRITAEWLHEQGYGTK